MSKALLFVANQPLAQVPPTDAYATLVRERVQTWQDGRDFELTTSGSTGTPKIVRLRRPQIEASIRATQQALDLRAGDRALVVLDVRYVGGLMMLLRALALDLEAWIYPPQSQPLAEIPPHSAFDFAAMVPLQVQTLTPAQLTFRKGLLIGGAPVSPALATHLQAVATPVYETYGMTETVSHVALRRLNGTEKTDYFRGLPGVTFGLDPEGCLRLRSPVTAGQWLQTRDRAELLAPDAFRWLGRADRTLNSGGIKVQPERVEAQLAPLWQEWQLRSRYFVAGTADPALGTQVTLFIEGALPPEWPVARLQAALRQHLPRFEAPRRIVCLPHFVLTASGKVDQRTTLRTHQARL